MKPKAPHDLVKISHRDAPDELDVHEIPLPTELPAKVDLSSLPDHILKSGTMEMLILQNEDLMARLSVNLRRNSNFETQLQQRDTEIRNLSLEISKLSDQVLIYQQKDNALKDRIRTAEDLRKEAEEDLQLAQTKLLELEKGSQTCIQNLEASLAKSQKRQKLLARYRLRIQKFVQPFVKEQRSQLALQKEKIRDLESKVIDREVRYTAMQERNAEMVDRIKSQTETHKNDILILSSRLEAQAQEKAIEINQLNEKIARLEKLARRADELSEQQIEWENRWIRAERQRDEALERQKQQGADLKQRISEAKAINNRLQDENESLQKALFTVRTEFSQMKLEFTALQEQKENLQVLWQENRRAIDELERKEQALQRINQDLSARLNEMRRQLEHQSANIDSQRLESDLQTRALKEELNLALKSRKLPAAASDVVIQSESDTKKPDKDAPKPDFTFHDSPSSHIESPVSLADQPIVGPIPLKMDVDRQHQEKMLERIEHLLSEIEVGMSSHPKDSFLVKDFPMADFQFSDTLWLSTPEPSASENEALRRPPREATVPPIDSLTPFAKKDFAEADPSHLSKDAYQNQEESIHSAVDLAFERINERRRMVEMPQIMPQIVEDQEKPSLLEVTIPPETEALDNPPSLPS
jgi:chromosome segregation ATPase